MADIFTCGVGVSHFAQAADAENLKLFKSVFLAYGALGARNEESYARVAKLTEFEKLQIVPLVFALLPAKALAARPNSLTFVKPLIREHLTALGIDASDDELLSILKRVVDQFQQATWDLIRWKGMSSLRIERRLYMEIRDRQADRCTVCGSRLVVECEETLDHVIPWKLLGDVSDGANWQILCALCNRGKREFMSALQSQAALNWLYTSNFKPTPPINISDEARYVALTRSPGCAEAGCKNTARTSRLTLSATVLTGLPIVAHQRVRCEYHLSPG